MAKDVVIRSVVYADTPEVQIPIQGGGTAHFIDTSDATLSDASNLPNGVTAYSNGTKYTGNAAQNTSSDLTASGATVTAPAGFYASSATKTTSMRGTSALKIRTPEEAGHLPRDFSTSSFILRLTFLNTSF